MVVIALKEEVNTIETENGYFLIKIGKVLKEKNISKNQLSRDTQTKFDVITHYMNDDIERLNIDLFDRFCDYLDCDFTDLVEYKRK